MLAADVRLERHREADAAANAWSLRAAPRAVAAAPAPTLLDVRGR
jgi:hypothetical protein